MGIQISFGSRATISRCFSSPREGRRLDRKYVERRPHYLTRQIAANACRTIAHKWGPASVRDGPRRSLVSLGRRTAAAGGAKHLRRQPLETAMTRYRLDPVRSGLSSATTSISTVVSSVRAVRTHCVTTTSMCSCPQSLNQAEHRREAACVAKQPTIVAFGSGNEQPAVLFRAVQSGLVFHGLPVVWRLKD